MNRIDAETEKQICAKLSELQLLHQDLDAAIGALAGTGTCDDLQMQRMKRRKLQVKDHIQRLEDLLHPDIIA